MEPQILSALCMMTFVGVAVGVATLICALPKAEEEPEPEPEPEEDEFDNEFTNYLAHRLDTSYAFRNKVLTGLTILHEHHSKVYSQVMKNNM